MTIEDILEETGGFGRFQILVVLCISLNSFTVGWSMLQMAYSGFVSDWNCLAHNDSQSENRSLKACYINSNSGVSDDVKCNRYQFEESPLTIVNEWHLVCDKSWVRATVTSIQMAGVLAGVILTGRLSCLIGMKKTMYIFVLEHAVLNLVAAFSINWHMFAACRFFIGVGVGVIIVCSFPYSLEFLPLKWRPIVAALPVWPLGIAVFALAARLMENWSHIHIACAVLSLPGLLGYFYVPESLHWLTVHDQIKEAQNVVSKIAVVNRKLELRKASIMLQTAAWEEQKARKNNKKCTYLDIFRERPLIRTTLMFSFHWFSLSVVYYGISFSVWSLAGNIYLNIFLLAIIEIPTIFLIFFDNKINRKLWSAISLTVACVAIFSCIIVHYHVPSGAYHSKAAIITGLCLVTKLGAGAAWAVVQSWGNEMYPLVTRGHGLLTVNVAACVGALVAPFLIDLEQRDISSFSVMGCLLFVDIILCILTHENKGRKPVAIFSQSISVDIPTSSVNLGHTHGRENESSTDIAESNQHRLSLEVPDASLGTIEEETSSNETDQNSIETSRENNFGIVIEEVILSTEATDQEINIDKVQENTTDTKKDNARTENINELKPGKISKKSSPEPKLRKNKLEKSKKNGEVLHGKSKSKPKEDFPPYIESNYHKNIRYSIY